MQNTNQELVEQTEEVKVLKQKDFHIISLKLHHVDFKDDNLIDASENIKGDDISKFINDLIDSIIKQGDNRAFVFPKDESYMSLAMNDLISENKEHSEVAKNIARRLLEKEADVHEDRKKKNLKHDLRKGSLLQVLLKRYDKLEYLILKIEHDSYFDLEKLIRHYGIAEKKSVIKSCLIRYNEMQNIDSVFLTDTNTKISTYWWKGFLELKKVRNDEENTTKVFTALKTTLNNYIKKHSPKEYRHLYDSQLKYFKEHESFNYSSFVQEVYTNYKPQDPNINYSKFLKRLEELGKSNTFDTKFEISHKVVESQSKSSYTVTSKITLTVDGVIPKGVIKAITEKNEKFLKIKIDDESTYKQFE